MSKRHAGDARSAVLWLRKVAAVALLVWTSAPAMAQTPGNDLAAAQALFDDAKRLMQEGHYKDACPKLVESQRLDPGGGTLLAIGLCHEAEGRTATAWGDFNLALLEARRDRRPEREAAAQEHIKELEKKMPRLRLVVSAMTDGLRVRRDGAAVPEAQWGTALPIDPGEHGFEASAPGKKEWTLSVSIKPDATTTDVTVPPLEDAETAPPTPAAPVLEKARASSPPSGKGASESSFGSIRTWGLITGGIGLVSVGVGTAFGLSASSKWNRAAEACPGAKCADEASHTLAIDAGTTADVSTGFFAAGGAALVTSAVLLLWPASTSASAKWRVTPLLGATRGVAFGGAL